MTKIEHVSIKINRKGKIDRTPDPINGTIEATREIANDRVTKSDELGEKVIASQNISAEKAKLNAEFNDKLGTVKRGTEFVGEILDHNEKNPANPKKFEFNKMGPYDLIAKWVKAKMPANGETASPAETARIMHEAMIDQYPQYIKTQLVKDGLWDKAADQFDEFKSEWARTWNMDRISQEVSNSQVGGMKVAGITMALTTVFGLGYSADGDSHWYQELGNGTAWKKSFSRKWKLALAGGLGLQAAGVPIAETVGMIARQGISTVWKGSGAIIDFLDKAPFRENGISEYFGGSEQMKLIPEQQLMLLVPAMAAHMQDPHRGQLATLFESTTGKPMQLDIRGLAKSFVMSSQYIKENSKDGFKADTSEGFKLLVLKQQYDMAAMVMMFHPRKQEFEDEVNKQINKPPTKKEQTDFIDAAFDNTAFEKEYNEKVQPLIQQMGPERTASFVENLARNGLTGLVAQLWLFLQIMLPLISTGFNKTFAPKDKTKPPTKEEQSGKKIEDALKLELTDKNWNAISKELKDQGVIQKSLKDIKGSQRKDIFKTLKEKGFGGNINTTGDIEGFARTQTILKDILQTNNLDPNKYLAVGTRRAKIIFGDPNNKNNTVYRGKLDNLKKTIDTIEDQISGITKKTISYKDVSKSLLALGVPAKFTTTIKTSDTLDNGRLKLAQSMAKQVLKAYEL